MDGGSTKSTVIPLQSQTVIPMTWIVRLQSQHHASYLWIVADYFVNSHTSLSMTWIVADYKVNSHTSLSMHGWWQTTKSTVIPVYLCMDGGRLQSQQSYQSIYDMDSGRLQSQQSCQSIYDIVAYIDSHDQSDL